MCKIVLHCLDYERNQYICAVAFNTEDCPKYKQGKTMHYPQSNNLCSGMLGLLLRTEDGAEVLFS